jgi:hypothetical protein
VRRDSSGILGSYPSSIEIETRMFSIAVQQRHPKTLGGEQLY